jgi:glycosyltransferase 2 family protein
LKKRILSVIQYLFFLLIGALLLWLVLRKIDLREVASQIKLAKYQWLLLSMGLGIVSHIVRAIRWNILIRSLGYKTETSTTFYAVMVGYLANTAFPRLGEVTRCGVLSKKKNIPFNALFGTVISERVFDFIVLVIILLLVIFLQFSFLKGFVDKYLITSLSGIANRNNLIMAIVIMAIVIVLPIILFRIFFHKIKNLKIYLKITDFLKGILEGITTIMKIEQKWSFLGLTVLIWLIYASMTYTAFFALDATSGLNFFDGITVMALGSLGIVAPTPGGIGAYQFIVKVILTEIYHIPSEPAVTYSIILWSAQTIMIAVMGFLGYYMLVFRKSKKNDNTRNFAEQNI